MNGGPTRADDPPVVVLASASPRRYELLARLGIEAEVRPAEVDEQPLPGEPPEDQVVRLAEAKATAIQVQPGALVIAADTLVVIDGDTLGKPVDPEDAALMLRRLSGREHQVCTGVHLRRDGRGASSVTTTGVRFRALDEREIAAYVGTGEPLDKAGGYGIQGAGGAFVDAVWGSDSNVVGLPLAEVVRLAAEVGVVLLPGGRIETD